MIEPQVGGVLRAGHRMVFTDRRADDMFGQFLPQIVVKRALDSDAIQKREVMETRDRLTKTKDVCAQAIGQTVDEELAVIFLEVQLGHDLPKDLAASAFPQPANIVFVTQVHERSTQVGDPEPACLQALKVDRVDITIAEGERCRNQQQAFLLLNDLHIST